MADGVPVILLDTCTLLWLAEGSPQLSPGATKRLGETELVFVSAVSAFEIGQKFAQAKLKLPLEPSLWFHHVRLGHQLRILPLMPDHAFAAAALPPLHKDPFDRLLIGSALHENLLLLTPDPSIRQYPGLRTDW